MTLDISTEERAFLLELLRGKEDSLLHEINHTDTEEFKGILKNNLQILQALKKRIERLD